MPQIFILGAVAAALVGWRVLRREMERVEERLAPLRANRAPEREGIALERDPVSGIYRPRQNG